MQDNKKPSENIFESLWMDAHPSLAPRNTLSYVLNGVKQTDQYNRFGYANEQSNELCVSLPEGYKLRGYTQIAERDEFIVFSYNGTNSEIGGINYKKCSYKKYLNDADIDCKLNFGFHEWIIIEPKRIQPCNDITLYWSNNRTYRYLNIDSPDIGVKNYTCEDLRLFKCNCAPRVLLRTIENGGYGVQNGIYQVAVRFTDEDSNVTNWFSISQHTKIFGGDNNGGEISNQFIHIKLDGLSSNYNFVDVAIVKTINYMTTVHLIYDKQPYNSNGITLDYRGANDEIGDLSIQELLKKDDYWINGKGLIQKDERLILFDLDNHWNLDYQRDANKAQVGWGLWRIKVEDAHKYPTLMGGENYMFGIEWNYCDGTKSSVFPFLGRKKTGADSAIVDDPCSECPREAWEVKDTSVIEMTHEGYGDPYQESEASEKVYKNFVPTKEPFKTVDEWGKDAKDEAENDIKDIKDIMQNELDNEDDAVDAMNDGDCCDGPVIHSTENDGEPDPNPEPVITTPKGNGDGNQSDISITYEGSNNSGGGSGADGLIVRSDCKDVDCTLSDSLCGEECDCVTLPGYDVPCTGGEICDKNWNGTDSIHPTCGYLCDCIEVPQNGGPNIYECQPNSKTPPKRCVPKPVDPDDPTDPGAENNDHDSNVPCQPIYDEDGCTVIDCIPLKIMSGQFGYAESKETYPESLDCDGEFIYGEEAGQPIRLFRVPSREKIPHFISYQTGVRNIKEPGNDELDRGYIQVIGLDIKGIVMPENTPKPLCSTNPFTIVMIKRDDGNKTVLAKGIFRATFEGEMYGDKTLFPRNGVNSLELFNRHINSSTNKVHAGYLSEVAGYTFHSPTTAFARPFIGGSKIKIDQEHYGKGWRHGLYSYGDQPGTPELSSIGGIKQIITKGAGLNVPKVNQKGYRGAVHLNKYKVPEKDSGSDLLMRCITDVSYVGANRVLAKGPNFSRTFTNKDSEACVFIELDKKMKLGKGIDPYLSDNLYNGQGGPDGSLAADQSADASFLGDVKFFETPIYVAAAHYGGIYFENKRQYGRLEKAAYISTGILGKTEDLISGSIAGWCGDTYITPYSFTASTYVSNLVGDDVIINDPLNFQTASNEAQTAPETGGGKNGGKAQGGAKGLKKVIANMTGSTLAWTLSLCAQPPVGGLNIDIDPRNGAGLRGFDNDPDGNPASQGGGFWQGPPFSFRGNAPEKDKKVYFPGLQKTEIITWVESDVAVPLRVTGHEEDKEINYFNTKSYDVDSSFSGNIGWKDKYINMFYMEYPDITLYQKIWMTFVIFACKIIIPLMVVLMLGKYVQGGGGIAGSLLSIIIQIVMLLIVIILIILLFIALKTFASEYLLQFLGLKQCYNDKQGGPGDGFKKDFHDNYCKYNWNYSSQNEFSLNFGMPINYNTCLCVAEPTNKIIYSNPQIIDAPNDAWRNFKVNNILNITSKYGKITTMIIRGQQLFAACTDMIMNLKVGVAQIELNDDTIELGRGDYINAAIPIADGVLEGYAGIKYPNGSINTALGFIFIDEEAGRIYSFDGNMPQEISNFGVRQFMKENLKFEYLKDRPDFGMVDQKSDSGIGYAIGYDYKQERILITKRDFKPSPDGKVMFNGEPCIDKSWTLSYDVLEKKWLSFHSYTPHLYIFDRYRFYAPKDNELWEFNKAHTYQTFFGEYHPFILEYSSLVDGMSAVNHDYTILETEGNKYNSQTRTYVKDLEQTFNKAIFYNTNQSTKPLTLIQNPMGVNVNASLRQNPNEMIISKLGRNWRFSELRDHCIDPNVPLFLLDEHDQLQVNMANLQDESKHDYLYDKYLMSRFTLHNDPSLQLICKRTATVFEYPSV